MWRRNPTSHVNQLSLSSWVMSPEKIQLRYGDTVDDLFSFVQVKLFQFRCYKVRDVRYLTIAANDLSKRTSLPPCTTVYNRCTPQPSEWTPARRALPPWPTTWPPSPSPWTTGSPGRCSISSSRGPKGSSATVYPTLAAVHVYSRLVLFIPYHSLLK